MMFEVGDRVECDLGVSESTLTNPEVAPSVLDRPVINFMKEIHDMPLVEFPQIVCLCGSTRFGDAFQKAQMGETLAGKIVLSIGCNMRSDTEVFSHFPEEELKGIKVMLDELHLRKIDLADEVLILNVGGYIGESTRRELEYAKAQGKFIRFLEPGNEEGKDA